MLQPLVVLHPQLRHQPRDSSGIPEVPHQIILKGDKELARTRISLTGTTSPQLPVDPPRLMPLRPHHMQSTQVRHPGRKLNVRSPTRHVRGNHHRTPLPRPRHDLRFQLVLFRIQNTVRNIFPPKHPADDFRGFHRGRSHQHRLARRIPLFDFLNQRIQLFPPGLEDQIIRILSDAVPVRWNHHHPQPVDVLEFVRLRLGRSRHPPQLLVQTKIILNRDGGQSLRLPVDLHPLLCLHRLMQPIAPPPPRHQPARVFIHYDHLVLLHHVMDILFEHAGSPQKLADVVDPLARLLIIRLRRRLGLQLFLGTQRGVRLDVVVLRDQIRHEKEMGIVWIQEVSPHLGQIRLTVPLVDREIHLLLRLVELRPARVLIHLQFRIIDRPPRPRIFLELQQQLVAGRPQLHLVQQPSRPRKIPRLNLRLRLIRPIGAKTVLLSNQRLHHRLVFVELMGRNRDGSRNDERRPRLVDQDAVHLVDDGIKVPSLDLILRRGRHSVVPQIIKTELRARPVGDVTRVLRPAFRLRLPVLQTTDRQPKLPVHLPHPVRISGRQIIVHRHHMNSFPGQRIQIGRQSRHQRLSLSRRHLGDLSRM